jgi:hypothetical protein
MAKKPSKSGAAWTPQDVKALREMAAHNRPTGIIAYELQRSEIAVRSKASEKKISLKPVNQSPYNRRKTS